MSELHTACGRGDIKLVTRLLNSGYDINETDEQGLTPIEHAFKNDNPIIVELLIRNKQIEIQGELTQRIFDHLQSITTRNIEKDREILASCFNSLGDSQADEADYEFMSACYSAAYEHIKPIVHENDKISYKAIGFLLNLVGSLQSNNQLETAKKKCKLAHSLITNIKKKDLLYLKHKKEILNWEIELALQNDDYTAAISNYQDMLNLQDEFNDKPTALIETHLAMGTIYTKLDDTDKALNNYKSAIKIAAAAAEKSDLMLLLVAKIQFLMADIQSKRLLKRPVAKQCYESAIANLSQLEEVSSDAIKLAKQIYKYWGTMYIEAEPGHDFCNTTEWVLRPSSTEAIHDFIALHGFILDANNWQIAKPFYQPFKDFINLIIKIYDRPEINQSIRDFFSDEQNRQDLLESLESLDNSRVLSLQKTINSGTAPLLAIATELGKVKEVLNENGLFSKKRTADESNAQSPTKKHKPDSQ